MKNPSSSLRCCIDSRSGKVLFAALLMLGALAHGLEVSPPEGWRRQDKPQQGILHQFIAVRQAGEFAPNLNVSRRKLTGAAQDSLKTTAQLGEQTARLQARMFPLFKVLESSVRKIRSVEGSLLVTSYVYGNRDLANLQFLFRDREEVVTLVYTCELKELDRLRPEFEKSLATLKAEPAAPEVKKSK